MTTTATAELHPNIILIDSASKEAPLTFGLRKAGFPRHRIIAVGAEIASYRDPNRLGIDVALREIGRQPIRPAHLEMVRSACEKAPRIFIATDTDQSGDALAQDIQNLVLGSHKNVWRARMHALDAESIAVAFSNPDSLEAQDAWPASARRMLDRMLQTTIAKPFCITSAALLSAMANNASNLGRLTLTLEASDGRDPFVANVNVTGENIKLVEALLMANIAFDEEDGRVDPGDLQEAPALRPWTSTEAILKISESTGRTATDVAATMRKLYETGRLSYPHSKASSLSPSSVRWLERVADRNGLRVDTRRVPLFVKVQRHEHESPHPMEVDVNLSTAALLLNQEDAVLSILTRHLISVAQPQRYCRPTVDSLPEWARGLGFKRQGGPWLNPWPRRRLKPAYKKTDVVERALELQALHGLGRPESGIQKAAWLASRGFFDADLKLTPHGHAQLDGLPDVLRDIGIAERLEQMLSSAAACKEDHSAPPQMVKDLLDGLGLWRAVEGELSR